MAGWPMRIMVYGAGEAIDGTSALAPEIQRQLNDLARICTNPSVAATAQLGASDVPTRRFVLDPSGRQPVASLPDVDVGDPASLLDFAGWSAAICPADRTMLVLSGHGAAWQDGQVDALLAAAGPAAARGLAAPPAVPGALHHTRSLFGGTVSSARSLARAVLIDGHDRDYISNAELGAVCEKIAAQLGRPLDAVVFDACLMSAWEILQELRGSAILVIASIDELSAAGIPLAAAAARLTARQGAVEPADLGQIFAASFTPQADFDSCVALEIGAAAWGEALSAFRACCAGLLPWVQASPANAQALQGALALAESSVVQYSGGGLADIGSLAAALVGLAGAPPGGCVRG